jgi:RNA polymerase sigma-32 factor
MLASSHRILTAEDERELATRWRDHGDRRALDELVLCNIRLAKYIAARWRRCGIPIEDLEQHAAIGLTRAAMAFDPLHGSRFSTFAAYWIRHEIMSAVHTSDMIHVPERVSGWKHQILAACASLREAGAEVTAKAVSQWLIKHTRRNDAPPSVRCIRAALDAWGGFVSLDAPIASSGGSQAYSGSRKDVTIGETVAAPAEDPIERMHREAQFDVVRLRLDALPPTERLILYRRFVEDKTLADAGEGLGISRERVRQIETRALLQARSGVDREVKPRSTWERLGEEIKQAILDGHTTREAIQRYTQIRGSLLRDAIAWLLFERHIVADGDVLRLADGIVVDRYQQSKDEWLDTGSAAKLLGISKAHLFGSFKRRIRNRARSGYHSPVEWLREDVERIAAERSRLREARERISDLIAARRARRA